VKEWGKFAIGGGKRRETNHSLPFPNPDHKSRRGLNWAKEEGEGYSAE
jgi:hypothetical protein